ncbi:Tautomerase/MIF superfamily [Endogone sp. FLAS-F59071]|nr:Tautomerase/MIF superfamily [Endogone sp. FLAS-F59071]|eukprot:RUS18026.1 Tautomerase/MIF superfamily [Endogone sp. FLAS-F59071]
MPALEIISNVAPKNLDAFVKTLSGKFAGFMGKPEAYCLVTFVKADLVTFAGSSDPAALIKISSIGAVGPDENKESSKQLADYLASELGIPGNRFYIFFTDFPGSSVGFNGSTF